MRRQPFRVRRGKHSFSRRDKPLPRHMKTHFGNRRPSLEPPGFRPWHTDRQPRLPPRSHNSLLHNFPSTSLSTTHSSAPKGASPPPKERRRRQSRYSAAASILLAQPGVGRETVAIRRFAWRNACRPRARLPDKHADDKHADARALALRRSFVSPVGSPQPWGCGGSGGERDRTDDLLLAKQALSRLSYTPRWLLAATAPTGVSQKRRKGRGSCTIGSRSLLRKLLSPRRLRCKQRWWAREDLNLRPHAYQARALTN